MEPRDLCWSDVDAVQVWQRIQALYAEDDDADEYNLGLVDTMRSAPIWDWGDHDDVDDAADGFLVTEHFLSCRGD